MLVIILVLIFETNAKAIDNKDNVRHRTSPIQDCKTSFNLYNRIYNSTINISQTDDGRHGWFRYDFMFGNRLYYTTDTKYYFYAINYITGGSDLPDLRR